MKALSFTVLIASCLIHLVGLPATAKEDRSAEILAVQIRKQGFTCQKPLRAEMDEKLSTPHMAAWSLRCDDAAYKVRLVPKMAAEVERVD
jgi:hypothetical protein